MTPGPDELAQTDEPSVVGLRVRPILPVALYALLVASAGLALWAQRAPGAPVVLSRVAPFLFLAFAVGFAAYRIALVVARRYGAAKAFFQIVLAALFFMLLFLTGGPAIGPDGRADPTRLLGHIEAPVRSLAAEVVGLRGDRSAGRQLTRLLEDPAPEVRRAAHDALVRLNGGVDLGDASHPAARAAWQEQFP